nr:MAG TPA: hypothetical protein [Caudoviricetes sp.]
MIHKDVLKVNVKSTQICIFISCIIHKNVRNNQVDR